MNQSSGRRCLVSISQQHIINKAASKDIYNKNKNKKGHTMDKRKNEKFVIRKARTERLQRSAVMHMQRLLNNDELKNRKIMSAISNIMPVNYDCI